MMDDVFAHAMPNLLSPEDNQENGKDEKIRKSKRKTLTRDQILFATGLVGVVHEMFFTSLERPTLLIVFAAMMGLPFLLRANGK
jgi:hypothetical protein